MANSAPAELTVLPEVSRIKNISTLAERDIIARDFAANQDRFLVFGDLRTVFGRKDLNLRLGGPAQAHRGSEDKGKG